jgi:hypothetical protein
VLTANNTVFTASGFNPTSVIAVSAGGHLTAANSNFTSSLNQVNLNTGCVLNDGDLNGDTFACPLYVPVNSVQYLSSTNSNNVSFENVEISGGTIASGQTLTLDEIGQSTANLAYIITGNLTVSSGGTMAVGPNVTFSMNNGLTLLDQGTLTFAAGDDVTINGGVSSQEIEVASGGVMTATRTTFASTSFNNGFLEVTSNGHLTATGCTFASSFLQVQLDTGCIVNAGDFNADAFNCPLYIPVNDVQDLSGSGVNNFQFQDIELLAGTILSGQTLALTAIGQSTANLAYILDGNLSVNSGGTVTLGSYLPLTVSGYTLTDGGTVSFAAGSTVTLGTITVTSGGLLTAAGTAFAGDGTIAVNSNGHFTASASSFASTISQVNLNTGCVMAAGDFNTDSFSCPLYIPVNDVQDLSGSGINNFQFQDIELLAGTILSGQTLALTSIGSVTTANLAFFLTGSVTISPGATFTQASDFPLTINSGSVLTDNGAASFAAGDTVKLSSGQIAVGSGGVLTATGTTFSGSGSISVSSNGHFTAASSLFASTLSQINLNTGSILNPGDFTGDSFSCPLYLSENEVQDLSGTGFSNVSFEDIEIVAGTLPAGQTLALNKIGTTTSNLAYFFSGNFTVMGAAALTIAAGVPVTINGGVTLTDDGTVTFTSGDLLTMTGFGSTEQVVVGNGGQLIANGLTVTGSGSGAANTITVAAGGAINAEYCGFTLTTVTLAAGSSGTLQYDAFTSQLQIDAAAGATVTNNDFSGVPASPVNDGILATGSSTGTVNLANNYWGTTNTATIAAKILDHTTASTRPTVVYSPLLSARPTAVSASPLSVSYSPGTQTVTLTAKVLSPSGAPNEGTVTFTLLSGSTPVGTAVTVNVVNGVASGTYTLPAGTPLGAYTIQAVYNGTVNYNGSTDSSQVLTVIQSGSIVTAANVGISFLEEGQTTTLTATITSPSGTVTQGTMTFTVLSGATVVGSPVTVNVSLGSASTPYAIPAGTPTGSYTIQAVYSGSPDVAAASDLAHSLTIGNQTTTTAAAGTSTTYSGSGQTVNLSATVTGNPDVVNAGTVTFTVIGGATVVGTPVSLAVSAGAAATAFTIPGGTASGTYTIQAVYTGAGGFQSSSDSSQTLTITAEGTSVLAANQTLTYSKTTSQGVNLSATVTGVADTVNTGAVTFTVLNGAAMVGTPVSVNVSSGVASTTYIVPAATAGAPTPSRPRTPAAAISRRQPIPPTR